MRVGAATRRKDIDIESKYKHYMTIKERVLKFISYKGIKPSHFEKTANLSNGAVSKMGNSTKRSTLNKILKAYPEINEVWLLTGSGSMLLDDKFNVKINIDAEAGNGGAASAIGDANVGINQKEQDELISLRFEIKELKKDQFHARKEHEELIQLRVENAGLRSQIAAKDTLIAELQKMNNFLMEKK